MERYVGFVFVSLLYAVGCDKVAPPANEQTVVVNSRIRLGFYSGLGGRRVVTGPRYGGLTDGGRVILIRHLNERANWGTTWETRHRVGARLYVTGLDCSAYIVLERATPDALVVRISSWHSPLAEK